MTEEESKKCAELWTEYEQKLRQICIAKMHGYTDEVDDIIAGLYLALCKQVSKKGLPEHTAGWLYGTLYNMIKKSFRDKYNKEYNTISANEIELPYMHDFVDDVIDNSTIEELKNIIATLDKSEQAILKYTYIDKHKMKEIAKLLGTTESAVKQKHYRLRHKLKNMMNKK